MNYPTSLDDSASLPNPGTTDKTNSPSHAALHSDTNAAVEAIEAKLGIGATTPVANSLLFGTGTGVSRWGTITSAELIAAVSDETGTGSLVFGTTPTLNTPKVDTINENTPANGVTIDSLNIKDGKLNTNSSVVTANITDGAVTNAKLSTATGEVGAASQAWTPTLTGFSADPASAVYRYTQVGKIVTLYISQPNNGTSNATGFTITLPVTAATITGMTWGASVGQIVNNSAVPTTPGLAQITSGGTVLNLYSSSSGANWTASNGKRIIGLVMQYEVA